MVITSLSALRNRCVEVCWGTGMVWLRYFEVFRRSLLYGLTTTFAEPILFLLGFGLGLSPLIGTIEIQGQELSYRAYVLAGIVAQAVLFQGFFEAAYGSFIRMYYQRIFQAIAVTPITLSEVLWGELLWDSTRATVSACSVLAVGVAIGDFSPIGALAAIPFCFLGALTFSALGLLVSAFSRTIEEISYPQYILVFPMFLFCGVFYPTSNLGPYVETGVGILPLTGLTHWLRSLTLGLSMPAEPLLWAAPCLWLLLLVPWSRRAMTRRLVA